MLKDWIAVFKVRVAGQVKRFSVCLDDILKSAEPFITKLDIYGEA